MPPADSGRADDLNENARGSWLCAARASRWRGAALAIWLLAFALYTPTLGFEFVWDDEHLIWGDEAPARGSLAEIWSQPFPLGDGAYFRPLVLTTFWVEKRLFGLDPHYFHAVQVVVYAFCCALVFGLTRSLARLARNGGPSVEILLPLSTAALFATHPVHVETVAFLSARTDLLATSLSVLAVLASVHAMNDPTRIRGGWVAASGLSVFAALLCKEVAIVTPLLAWLAVRVGARRRQRTRVLVLLGAQGVAVGAYLVLRTLALGAFAGGRALEWGSPASVLAGCGRAAELLLVPLRLDTYYLLSHEPQALLLAVAGAFSLALALGAGLAFARSRPLLSCGLLWVPVCLAPTSGVVAISGAAVAERFLFLPSVGLCLLAALGLERGVEAARGSPAVRRGLIGCACAILVLFAVRTLLHTPSYRANLPLFEQIAAEYPDFYYGHLGVGMHHQKAGRPDLALAPLERAALLSPEGRPGDLRRGDAARWLGLSYLSRGRFYEAVLQLEKAASLRPRDEQSRVNLAVAYLQLGRPDEAERVLREALALEPALGEAQLNLGIVLARRGAPAEALPHLERAVELLPGVADAHYNLGNGYARLGRDAEAVAAYRHALELEPQHAAAQRNLGLLRRPRPRVDAGPKSLR
jgi:tetratricopeptide (TPR) repeat protein